jgi:isoquinoline 1-oxidoreductase subunit beta
MKLSRRKFLIGTGLVGGGLIIGLQFKPKLPIPGTLEGSFQPNAWLQITEDGRVIFQCDKVEMGQGVMTSMSTVIGEELDYNPVNIIVELSGIHPAFRNTAMGVQLTGASTSTPTTYMPLREAGATARALLIKAAAQLWDVNADECTTDDGKVFHAASQKSATYGELVKTASTISDAGKVVLKDEKNFRWIGQSIPRIDAPAKVDGTAVFGMDIDFPDIKIAVVKRCPHLGGNAASYDDKPIKSMDGVKAVFAIHSGIAIVADSYWQARKACDALEVKWNKGPLAGLDSDYIRKDQIKTLADKEAQKAMKEGDADTALAAGAKQLSANYATPYFHHSPMEPQNTTAIVRKDSLGGASCEVWSPTQSPDMSQTIIAHYTGIKRDKITVHTTLMGGAFGRRGYVDFAGEAGAIAAAYPGLPVKLIWSREDDMQHDFFRGATYHGIKAALDEQGNITAWQHKLLSTSIVQTIGTSLFTTLMPGWIATDTARSMSKSLSDGIADYDPGMSEGAKIPYAIPNIHVGTVHYDPGIPTGFWRSVGHFHNAFVVESFIDECAYAAGKDPAQVRREYLKDHPRHLGVLEEVLKIANWGKSGKHQGLAVHESFKSYVAQVVEVTVTGNTFTVDKVYCAVDCGLPINPDIIKQQMESCIVYGLTAALKTGITFKDGVVEQSNFHDLPVLRMNEMPDVEVSIINSREKPGGLGETAVPPLAPALGNALFAATGQRLRELPFKLV